MRTIGSLDGTRSSTRFRFQAAGLVLLLAGVMIILASSPARGNHVDPVLVRGNPSCANIVSSWDGLKVEPVADGTYSDGTLTVTVDVRGRVFDWTSNIGVDAVIVKGGPDANLYRYDPPAEETEDTGLHAPTNASSGEFYGLSHISFCYDGGAQPSPSPSPTETETESPSPSPTVTVSPTVTESPTGTTTASPSPTIQGTQTTRTTASPTSTVAGARLARTGDRGDVPFALFIGAATVMVGLLLVGASLVLDPRARSGRR
jgi:uncharacterized Zn-binding protein involved in type VI secretion